MNYILSYSANTGEVLGFYLEGLQYSVTIPEPTIKITQEEHDKLCLPDRELKVIDGKLISTVIAVDPLSEPLLKLKITYDEKKAEALRLMQHHTALGKEASAEVYQAKYQELNQEYITKYREIKGLT